MFCHACGGEIPPKEKYFRQDLCPSCDRPVHCCKNCKLYAPDAYQQCREPQTEWVSDKEAPNFCTFFKPGDQRGTSEKTEREAAARKKLDDLFKR